MPEFIVYYIKSVSTWHNDWEHRGKRVMTLDHRPIGDERAQLASQMEDEFIHDHRKRRRNLCDVKYKITKIVELPLRSKRRIGKIQPR